MLLDSPRPRADWDGLDDRERIERLRELLIGTTRSHLVSDVRAGSCLSGGLDSSAVVGLIGKIWREQPGDATAIGDQFNTFTSCYEYPELDERQYALDVANSIGATPHLVFPSAADFWDVFGKMAWHQDMPFSGMSFYAQWRVMRAAREAGVKVLLDGQGGDEVFGGYAKFRYAYLASLLRARAAGHHGPRGLGQRAPAGQLHSSTCGRAIAICLIDSGGCSAWTRCCSKCSGPTGTAR